MIDTVLQFEGDRNHVYRILRSLKTVSVLPLEIASMKCCNGLREVSNPSERLISHKDEELSGTVPVSTLEGMRPLMIEIKLRHRSLWNTTTQHRGYNAKRLI
jgi:DNA repair protein RadA/Sms